jgi:hypothetical protein
VTSPDIRRDFGGSYIREIDKGIIMKKIIFLVLFVILTCPAWAQEIFVKSGVTRDVKTGTAALQWGLSITDCSRDTDVFLGGLSYRF